MLVCCTRALTALAQPRLQLGENGSSRYYCLLRFADTNIRSPWGFQWHSIVPYSATRSLLCRLIFVLDMPPAYHYQSYTGSFGSTCDRCSDTGSRLFTRLPQNNKHKDLQKSLSNSNSEEFHGVHVLNGTSTPTSHHLPF
jgi:hypothetical protein